jgi:isopentenyl-diphosphate delta-isomerase
MSDRKAEHIQIVINEDVNAHYRYWDDIELFHEALPDIDLDEISTAAELFGKKLSAPIVITGMTGGFSGATSINRNLAKAAAEMGIGFGVGSERAAVSKGEFPESYTVVKDYNVPLKLANIGAPQLIEQKPGDKVMGVEEATKAMELIGANVLAVHLNFLQEWVQPEGERKAKGCISRIAALSQRLPVVAKETGAGISIDTARRLKQAGVIGFDISGRGGTSFAAVEYFRALKRGDKLRERIGKTLWDWGIPSPVSVMELSSLRVPIIASGGIRTGLDVARAISIGADSAGIAGGIISAATQGYDETLAELTRLVEELKAVMFLTGSRNVKELRAVRKVIRGETRLWIE